MPRRFLAFVSDQGSELFLSPLESSLIDHLQHRPGDSGEIQKNSIERQTATEIENSDVHEVKSTKLVNAKQKILFLVDSFDRGSQFFEQRLLCGGSHRADAVDNLIEYARMVEQ